MSGPSCVTMMVESTLCKLVAEEELFFFFCNGNHMLEFFGVLGQKKTERQKDGRRDRHRPKVASATKKLVNW